MNTICLKFSEIKTLSKITQTLPQVYPCLPQKKGINTNLSNQENIRKKE